MNIKAIDKFITACSARKGRFLLISSKESSRYSHKLRIIRRPKKEHYLDSEIDKLLVPNTPSLSHYDIIGFDFPTLIRVIFEKTNLEGCYYFTDKCTWMSTGRLVMKRDIEIVTDFFERHPCGLSHYGLLESKKDEAISSLLLNRSNKTLCEQWRYFRPKYESAISLARDIRREVYTLFRYFSDNELRQLSLELFNTVRHKKLNKNETRLLELKKVIEKLANYSREIDGIAEEIHDFLRETEEINDKAKYSLSLPKLWRHDSDVTYKDVISLLKSAKYGSSNKVILHN